MEGRGRREEGGMREEGGKREEGGGRDEGGGREGDTCRIIHITERYSPLLETSEPLPPPLTIHSLSFHLQRESYRSH